MRLKFCVALVLAALIINSMTGLKILAQNEVIEFADVKENFWAKGAIDNWKDRGIIKGDGRNFNPNNNITRAEMVVILDNIFKYDLKKENLFSDIKEEEWHYDALIKAYSHDVIKGDYNENGDLVVRPKDSLTRAEAAVIFTNVFAIEVPSDYVSNFKDDNLPKWAKNSIFAMEAAGYIRGKGEGLFEPNSNLTRAEMVQILDNVIELYIDSPKDYNVDVTGNVVINSPGVKLKNMKVDGNIYLAEGIGDGDIVFENVYVSGTTFIRGGGNDEIKVINSDLGKVKIEKDGLNLDLGKQESGDLEDQKEENPTPVDENDGNPGSDSDGGGIPGGDGTPSGDDTPDGDGKPDDQEDEKSKDADSADIVDY